MANVDENDWLRKRLDTIIQLLLESSSGRTTSTSSKIGRLLEMGLSQAEVAQIIGKRLNYVTATVAMKRKGAAHKKKQRRRGTGRASLGESIGLAPGTSNDQ